MVVLLGLLALGALIWLGRQGHRRGGSWRAAASFLGLVAILGAVVFSLRNNYILASLCLSFAATSLLSVRKLPNRSGSEAPASRSGMGRAEALQILGLNEAFSRDDVKRAHSHLIRTCHPDAGGSAHLAAQINAARDVLLRSL